MSTIIPATNSNWPKAEYTTEDEEPPAPTMDTPALDNSPIENPAAPALRYLGRESRKLLYRVPGYALNLDAEFVANRPGRMNLVVTAFGANNADLDSSPGVPIIVLPSGAPATLVAGREEVRGYRKGFDGREYLASTSGNSYMTNVLILQPGDHISMRYFSIERNRDFMRGRDGSAARDPNENLKPVINVRPFLPDTRYDLTEWIVDYLPK